MTEDRGLSLKCQANSVSSFMFSRYTLYWHILRKESKPFYQFFQAWIEVAGRINCPAPLPEDQETPLLMKMLFPAPYEVPEKKAKKTAKGGRSGPRRKGVWGVTCEDETLSSAAEDNNEEEEESDSPPEGGRKKRVASTDLEAEAEASKKGKVSLADNSALYTDSSSEWRPREKPLAEL